MDKAFSTSETIPRIHNVGDRSVTSNPCLINGGACFPETVHTSEGNSISSGRMEITSGIPPVLHAHSGISPKRELAIQGASGFSNNSRFSFSIGNPADMPTTVMDVSAPSFNSNEAHPQSKVQYSLEVNPTDLPNTKSCCRTELGVSIPELHEMPMHNPVLKIGQSVFSEEAEKTASLLLEQERLKQMVHDLEQDKSEMANTLEDMRAQLQSKTLETTQQNLYEFIEQKDALAVDSDIDSEKASGLLEEKLRTQVQSLNDENHNLLTQLDEHAKNMAMTEQENQLVRNELAEMKLYHWSRKGDFAIDCYRVFSQATTARIPPSQAGVNSSLGYVENLSDMKLK